MIWQLILMLILILEAISIFELILWFLIYFEFRVLPTDLMDLIVLLGNGPHQR